MEYFVSIIHSCTDKMTTTRYFSFITVALIDW